MRVLETMLNIPLPTLVNTLTTTLIVALTAGILWALVYYLPRFVARYLPAIRGIGLTLLQLLIVLGGVGAVGRFVNSNVALLTVALLAIIWCSTVFRETYLLTKNQLHLEPVDPLSIPGAAQGPPRAGTSFVNTPAHPPTATAVAPIPTKPPPRLPAQSFEGTARAQLPSRRLTKRPMLGRQTVSALQVTILADFTE